MRWFSTQKSATLHKHIQALEHYKKVFSNIADIYYYLLYVYGTHFWHGLCTFVIYMPQYKQL